MYTHIRPLPEAVELAAFTNSFNFYDRGDSQVQVNSGKKFAEPKEFEEKFVAATKSWEKEFFVVDWNGQPRCLICNKNLSMKRSNLSRHYDTHHAEFYKTFPASYRAELLKEMKERRGYVEKEIRTHQQQSVAASFAIALEIARSKKSYTDGEFVKRCAIEMAKAFGDEIAAKKYEAVPLSRHESTDVVDISQLCIFVRSIDDKFQITEELLEVVPLIEMTQGKDIFAAFYKTVEEYGGFSKCTAIVTGGAREMVGQEKGLRGLLRKHGINCPTFHCIIHQEALCGKIISVGPTMKIVTKIVNTIRGGNKSLSHRKFRLFLESVDAIYNDLSLYCEVRWLSAGKTLERFFALRKEILEFLQTNSKLDEDIIKKMDDIEFLCNLAFITDITKHLNCLNSRLQTQNQTISDLICNIYGFRNQIDLFIAEIKSSELHNFPACKQIADEYRTANFDKIVPILEEIAKEFKSRFQDFNTLDQDLQLFNNPQGCEIRNQKQEYRLELCNLQADPFAMSRREHGQEFFKLLPMEKYPKLIDFGLRICSMFGTTYKCEAAFSTMKFVKSKYRSSLSIVVSNLPVQHRGAARAKAKAKGRVGAAVVGTYLPTKPRGEAATCVPRANRTLACTRGTDAQALPMGMASET
ncbi:general transcription factor II-I repeat domain-containing protein 2B-like [Lasioglossum baleicum]|uniref:general transcription factor II-I repeat domain-containing protein 2B-like n=1 Tax=Lasioglossum baleicum TaxID=434251 RepID=UPI003FCD89DE